MILADSRLLSMECPRTDWIGVYGYGADPMPVSVCIICDPIMHADTGDFCVLRRFVFSAKSLKPDALHV